VSLWNNGGGEQLLSNKITNLLAEQGLGELWHIISKAGGLDGTAIDRQGMVHQQLGVDVRSEWRVENAVAFADVSPRLEVLLVDLLGYALEIDLGNVRHDATPETGLNLEDRLEMSIEALLREIGLVGQVPHGSGLALTSQVHDGLADIANMDSVDAQISRPQELHLLVELRIHSTGDDSWR
jgi:hypothetical protein